MLSFGKGAPCTFQLAMALWPKSKRNGWMICRAGATRCNTLPSHWRHGKIILNSTDNSRKLKKTEENWRKVVSWCLMYLIPIDTYWHSKRKHCKQYIRVHWSSCKQENRPRTEYHREPPRTTWQRRSAPGKTRNCTSCLSDPILDRTGTVEIVKSSVPGSHWIWTIQSPIFPSVQHPEVNKGKTCPTA